MHSGLGNLYPNWAKCLKSGQNFPRSEQFFFHQFHAVFKPAKQWFLIQVDCSKNLQIRLLPTPKRPVFVLTSPTCPCCAGAQPQSSAVHFAVKVSGFNCFLKDPLGALPYDLQGQEFDLILELCSMTNELWRICLLWNPWINCVDFYSF